MAARKKLDTGAPGRPRASIRQAKKREDLPCMTKRGAGDQKTIGPVEQAHSSDPGQRETVSNLDLSYSRCTPRNPITHLAVWESETISRRIDNCNFRQ